MDAILTHESADFDALASLLGARKIYPSALAILPRKLNRNARDFCALYGDALALTQPEDLPRRKLREIVVVDTQSVPSVRGLVRSPKIHFVDHHPLARALKNGATFSGGDVGATTTIFVEEIVERGLPLSPIEATLLLLGIYEDTGSLSYPGTTARDVRAAAYLLEHEANLAEVNEFLHQPLSQAQRKLYHKLFERVETIEVAGHLIAVAATRADTYTDEVSAVAHQLREVYDPAALFLLVQMEEHIQLVARSDRAAIDVGAIAQALGGGGHERAAAAVLRETDLKQAKARLVKLLKETVQPSVTVRELMSFGARTLAPSTTVAQAAEMMNRYGHEGFPVVQRGKLLGVVTRREIDRAIHHKLANSPIRTLMHKPVSVKPTDSLERLRAVMIESGLGQVPVVNTARHQVVGIVTRTDVIKQSGIAHTARAPEIAARLEKWLPPEVLGLLRHVSETARELGFSLYLVGGFVRDLLLNQPNLDLDLVVEGDAIQLAQRLAKKFGGRVHGHTRFGTAKWILEPNNSGGFGTGTREPIRHLDFTTARTEFYEHPSALPQVERSSIKQDLRRRDFTINTLAICLDPNRFGQLIDPFGGEEDLQEGVIRVLHNLSFVEDPTRILRAVRFEQRFGFQIEARTSELITDAREMLQRVSGERIRNELSLIFEESEPEKTMYRLAALGVLHALFSGLEFTKWHAEKFSAARGNATFPAVHYFGLLAYQLNSVEAAELAARLSLTNAEMKTLQDVIALREQTRALAAPRLRPSEAYRTLSIFSDNAVAIYARAVDHPRVCERVERFLTEWRTITPALSGRDLKRMGVTPGPLYREILERLLDARLDGSVSTPEEERALARAIAKLPAEE